MSEQRSPHHSVRRGMGSSSLQRAYLATLARRLFGRGNLPSGPGAINHSIATRIIQARRRHR